MKCKICLNEFDNNLYEVEEMMYGAKEKFHYFQCSKCKCLQIEQTPDDISKYYVNDYYSFENKSHLHRPKNFFEFLKRYMVNKRNYYAVFNSGIFGRILYSLQANSELKSLSKLSLSYNSKILDVGCGIGAHLYFLKELGFENVVGIDPYIEKEIIHDNDMRIFKNNIKKISEQFQIIMYHHSFEHIEDPYSELNRIYELLYKDGICVIRIPTVSSYAWSFYGINWVQLDAPRHFFLHSLDSIKILAEKTGFELFQYYYDSDAFQFWGSEQYKVGINLTDERSYAVNPDRSIFSKKDITEFTRKAKSLNKNNQGDQVVLYLRKLSKAQ